MIHHRLFIKVSLLVLALLALTKVTSAHSTNTKIYSWKNEQGIIVFSDTAHSNAHQPTYKPPNIIKLPRLPVKKINKTEKKINKVYRVIINTPHNNVTIRDNTGSVDISGQVLPELNESHSIQLYLDEKPYKPLQKQFFYSLENIERGKHLIKVILLDDKGKIIASSKRITFYLHRALVTNLNSR